MLENLISSLNAVIPIFLFLIIGYAARAAGVIRREDVSKFNKVNFSVFIPVLVAWNIYNSDIHTAFNPVFVIYAVVGLLCEVGIGLLFAHFFVEKTLQRGVVVQGIFRTNIALVGITLLSNLVPNVDLGPISLLTAFTTLTINSSAVAVLEVYSGRKPDVGTVLKGIIKNPIILGAVTGMVLLLTGIRFPSAIENTARDLARVASPLALFLLGAFFRFGDIKEHVRVLSWTVVLRLLIMPAIFLTGAYFVGLRGIFFASLIPVFASANAAPSFTMVQKIGGDEELAGNIVVFSSLFCPFTIFLWCFIFQTVGAF